MRSLHAGVGLLFVPASAATSGDVVGWRGDGSGASVVNGCRAASRGLLRQVPGDINER